MEVRDVLIGKVLPMVSIVIWRLVGLWKRDQILLWHTWGHYSHLQQGVFMFKSIQFGLDIILDFVFCSISSKMGVSVILLIIKVVIFYIFTPEPRCTFSKILELFWLLWEGFLLSDYTFANIAFIIVFCSSTPLIIIESALLGSWPIGKGYPLYLWSR